MSSYTVAIDAAAKQPDGSCEIRLATSTPGKYVTFTVKDGETITTKDPVTALALQGLALQMSKVVTALAQDPAKPTHDADTKPKTDLPPDSKLAVQDGATK